MATNQQDDVKNAKEPSPSNSTFNTQSSSIRSVNQTPSFAAKIAELFLTAGVAFQKLGDLTAKLNAVNVDHEENRWTEKDVENLREAISRFANDLDNVSQSILVRSKKMIRTDIKRRTLQMGIEPGGTSLTGARTVLKPVSQTDPYLAQTSYALMPSTSKNSTGLSSVNTSLNSTTGAPPKLDIKQEPQRPVMSSSNNSVTNSLTASQPSTSAAVLQTQSPSTSMTLKQQPVIKKVIVPSTGPINSAIRRPVQPMYRAQSGLQSTVRVISNPQTAGLAPGGRKLLVANNHHLVRVVNQPGYGMNPTQRVVQAGRNPRYQLHNGYVNEEVVYTSPGPGVSNLVPTKRPLTDQPSPPTKQSKLELGT